MIMKYDREKFEIEFNNIINMNSISYNSETGEWSRKGIPPGFGEEAPDVVINTDEEEYQYLADLDPAEIEQEPGDELVRARENLRETLFNCLDIFTEDIEYRFFYAYSKFCQALNELWMISGFDGGLEQMDFMFLSEIDADRTEKIWKELFFCMYSHIENWEAKAYMLTNANIDNDIFDFPYPGYFRYQAFLLIDELGELSGEGAAWLEKEYSFLLDIYYHVREKMGMDD